MGDKSSKIRVAVLYGGKSGEHEVSLRSASSVVHHLDPKRYDIVPVAIDKEGHWHINDIRPIQANPQAELPVLGPQQRDVAPLSLQTKGQYAADVVFPVMHGPLCEDGAVQGLLELAGVPYVGCGILASSVGMDKDVTKRLLLQAGLPVVPYVAFKLADWSNDQAEWIGKIEQELDYPAFVKPANMGSSVGVHKVKSKDELIKAVDDAFQYDRKVLVERFVEGREIELSVLESLDPKEQPQVSVPGEIAPTHEFYSYEAKYLDEKGADLIIPADLKSDQETEVRQLAAKIFSCLECEGMARIDFFLEKSSGKFLLNEINTIPGFTSISMYPKLWEASGMSYSDLLDYLIELALKRHRQKLKLKTDGLPVK